MQQLFKNISFNDCRDSDLVYDFYKSHNNYCIIDNPDASSDMCILFVSGNGLYYPNTIEIFENIIVKNNHFEWMNIAQNPLLKTSVKRFIFIRDIFKQWYLSGINEKIDSIHLLVNFLKDKTFHYDLTVVGNSAGGGLVFYWRVI